ncbi:MAG TPA: SpoIIE family protein phosphatase, partial [Jatrophihabitantaceae bacterium]
MDLERGPAGSAQTRLDLVAAAGVGIMSINTAGHITSANEAATEMLGCAESDLVGRAANEALNAELPEALCELDESARTGVGAHVDDDTFTRGDGALIPVWWATTPLRDTASGTLAGAVLVFGDTSVQRAQAVVEAAERDQGRADLAQARQNVSDLEWIAEVTQVLSSTLDEREVLERLARLVVGRLSDVAITDIVSGAGELERVGYAVADGIDVDIDSLAFEPVSASAFDRDSTTFRTITAGSAVRIEPSQFDDDAVLSPQSQAVLRTVGASDALAVSLVARGRTVGALRLVRVGDSPQFDDVDLLVATDIAQRAALASDNARLYRAQTDISSRLQQALLPAVPKDLPVEVGVRYLPARHRFDVGGDWYDVFRAPERSDTTVLVIGDVAGHDLDAGTSMSALRNLVRGIVVATKESPGDVLSLVDTNMATLGIGGTATALVMTVVPLADGRWHLRWSNAGHMPPLIITPESEVEMLNDVHGTLLGTEIIQVRLQSERIVDGGSTIVLYTDGLVETREDTIDNGLIRLRRTAMSLSASIADPGAIADELLARNHASTEDDT